MGNPGGQRFTHANSAVQGPQVASGRAQRCLTVSTPCRPQPMPLITSVQLRVTNQDPDCSSTPGTSGLWECPLLLGWAAEWRAVQVQGQKQLPPRPGGACRRSLTVLLSHNFRKSFYLTCLYPSLCTLSPYHLDFSKLSFMRQQIP